MIKENKKWKPTLGYNKVIQTIKESKVYKRLQTLVIRDPGDFIALGGHCTATWACMHIARYCNYISVRMRNWCKHGYYYCNLGVKMDIRSYNKYTPYDKNNKRSSLNVNLRKFINIVFKILLFYMGRHLKLHFFVLIF